MIRRNFIFLTYDLKCFFNVSDVLSDGLKSFFCLIFYTFAINAILVAVTALLITPTYLAKFDMGDNIGLKAFFAAIIGGFNNSRGALLGGILVGVLENLAGAYLTPAYKDGVALVLFLAVILVKPDGLLGTPQERKV